jgi:hypothetical protein
MPMISMHLGGILGLLLLIADIWAIVKTVESSVSTGAKVGWILAIIVFPVLGFIVWLIAGPSGQHRISHA